MSTRTAPPPSRRTVTLGTPPASVPTGRRPRRTPTPPASQAAAELALVGLTVAAVLGLGRLFTDGSYLPPVLTVLLAGHAVAWGARRLGLGPLGAVLASGVGLLLVVAWVVEPATTTMGLPLSRTWAAIGEDLRAAWATFGEVRAPTPATRGFVLAAAMGAWVAAFAADTFAFRARTRLEALVPSFVLFLFGALIGADRDRLATTVLYLTAVLVFVVLSEPSRRSQSSWFAGRSADGERALVRAGIATALVGVAVAFVAGPQLPGAKSPGLVGWRDGADGDSSSRVTESPLVSIRSRLVNQSNTELFTVRSPEAAYWRLTSLERYDGSTWSLSGSFGAAVGNLPTGVPSRARERTVRQDFDVKALSAPWLPAAYRPEGVSPMKGVQFDEDSGSLLTDATTSDGLRYSVVSALPQFHPGELSPATGPLSRRLASRYLLLPADFPAPVRREAERVTSAAAACPGLDCSPEEEAGGRLTPFHTARALQDWFRSTFTYSLDVKEGHGESAIESFLATKAGYCEQFAGTFAAMARSVGLPSRVAVGFTPGTPGDDGAFHVTGKEAHAWPEVHIPGFGWVAFEPTPGRAVPGGESYTGVSPSAVHGPEAPPTTTPTAPTTVAPSPAETPPATPAPDPSLDPATRGARSGGPLLGVAVAVLAAAALSYVVGVPLGRRGLRGRRRAAATTPTARVLVSWQEAEEDLRLAGRGRRPAETGPEYVQRLEAAGTGTALTELDELARHRSAAAYSPTGVDEPTARRAEAAAAAVREALRREAGPIRRLRWAYDPRPLALAAMDAREEHRERSGGRRTPRPA